MNTHVCLCVNASVSHIQRWQDYRHANITAVTAEIPTTA